MTTYEHSTDPIIRLALRIARRADEIGQRTPETPLGLGPWLAAEKEILGIRLPEPNLQTAAGSLARREHAGAMSASGP
jgi:hypothetical protein